MGELIETYTTPDKIKHILVCCIIMLYTTSVFRLFLSKFIAIGTAFIVTMVIGMLKELYDKKHSDKHVASKKDFVADVFGAVLALIPLTLM